VKIEEPRRHLHILVWERMGFERVLIVHADRWPLPETAAFAVAWSEDRAMTLEQAIEYALGHQDLQRAPTTGG
jgi:hypothetical protein